MTDAEYAALCANIATLGLRQAITLYSGAVLDGWHRYQACLQTGVEPRYETFEGDDVGARRFLVLGLIREYPNRVSYDRAVSGFPLLEEFVAPFG